jgi:hypothetical protein
MHLDDPWCSLKSLFIPGLNKLYSALKKNLVKNYTNAEKRNNGLNLKLSFLYNICKNGTFLLREFLKDF